MEESKFKPSEEAVEAAEAYYESACGGWGAGPLAAAFDRFAADARYARYVSRNMESEVLRLQAENKALQQERDRFKRMLANCSFNLGDARKERDAAEEVLHEARKAAALEAAVGEAVSRQLETLKEDHKELNRLFRDLSDTLAEAVNERDGAQAS